MPEDKEAPVYTAEKILLKRVRKGKVEYFIKWKGWAAKFNTWEPERHILDKLLIDDFNNRNRKQQKSKPSVRSNATKQQTTRKTRQSSASVAPRTRRVLSSSSSDISTSAIISPETNDENDEDEQILSERKIDHDRQDTYKLRSKQQDRIQPNLKELSDSSKESDEEEKQTEKNTLELNESLREYLWQPTKPIPIASTITEITDPTGLTVLIREIDDNSYRSSRNLINGGKH